MGVTGTQNTLNLVDGRPVIDLDLSGVQWSAVPLTAIDRIEIMRGAGSVIYGGGATAGRHQHHHAVADHEDQRRRCPGPHRSYATRGRPGSATTSGARPHHVQCNEPRIGRIPRPTTGIARSTGLADMRWLTENGDIALKLGTDLQGIRLARCTAGTSLSAGINQLATDRRGTSTPLDYAQRDGNRATLDWRQRTGWGNSRWAADGATRPRPLISISAVFRTIGSSTSTSRSLNPRAKVEHTLGGVRTPWWPASTGYAGTTGCGAPIRQPISCGR